MRVMWPLRLLPTLLLASGVKVTTEGHRMPVLLTSDDKHMVDALILALARFRRWRDTSSTPLRASGQGRVARRKEIGGLRAAAARDLRAQSAKALNS